jgi:hypothetical protein
MVSVLAVFSLGGLSYIEEDGWRDMNTDHSVCLSNVRQPLGRM